MNDTQRNGDGFLEHRMSAGGGVIGRDRPDRRMIGPLLDQVVPEDQYLTLAHAFAGTSEMIGVELIVLIQIGDQFAPGGFECRVASGRLSSIGRVTQDTYPRISSGQCREV